MKLPFTSALVTGGAGFIGSHLVDELVGGGCRVKVLDNLSTGRIENLDRARSNIEFIQGDIRDTDTVLAATQDCEAVFHLAAMVSVPQTVADPLVSSDINIMGTATVLEAARLQNTRSFVLASSCAAYGDDPHQPKTEQMPTIPLSPYALQKLTAERYMTLFHQIYAMSAVSLRFFNVYGPRQDPSSPYSGVISIFMNQALAAKPPTIYGDGNQSRDFIYVTDIVRALLMAANPAAAGQVINVGSGRSVTIAQLWGEIASLAGIEIPAQYAAARTGDIRHSLAGIDLARNLLKFEPAVGLDTGLRQTFEWYKENRI